MILRNKFRSSDSPGISLLCMGSVDYALQIQSTEKKNPLTNSKKSPKKPEINPLRFQILEFI